MADRAKKDQLFEQFARISKALSSPRRLELLDLLCQGERTVESLAREADLSIANASQHLQVLRAARLVETRKEEQYVYYRLADPTVGDFWLKLRDLARLRLAEMDQVVQDYFDGRQEMVSIDRDELLRRATAGEVTLLDVRPVEEYEAAHLPTAKSVPLEALPDLLDRLPRDQEIVAYCRGPYCVFATDAVEILRQHGFKASRFEEGVLEWRASGLPIEAGRPATV
jgi:rhodanese-related sulfurtransferase/predicted transcriptional regulator